MKPLKFTIEQLVNQVQAARLTQMDLKQINRCRRQHNRLGFGYQLSFVRLVNRFPTQQPFEVVDDILNYVSAQLSISAESIQLYSQRRETVSEHQEWIREYLGLQRFSNSLVPMINQFLFEEACRIEQTNALVAKVELFLKEQKMLRPSDSTLQRLIGSQRNLAREFIFKKISSSLSSGLHQKLDALLETEERRSSGLYFLKYPPGRPSPAAMLKLVGKLEMIGATGVLDIDLSWLSNNFQRSLARYTKRCDVHKMRELESPRRYAALVCFLAQTYCDTTDFMIDMYDKLINKTYNHAQVDIDNHNKSQRRQIRKSMTTFKTLAELILDERIEDSVLREEYQCW